MELEIILVNRLSQSQTKLCYHAAAAAMLPVGSHIAEFEHVVSRSYKAM